MMPAGRAIGPAKRQSCGRGMDQASNLPGDQGQLWTCHVPWARGEGLGAPGWGGGGRRWAQTLQLRALGRASAGGPAGRAGGRWLVGSGSMSTGRGLTLPSSASPSGCLGGLEDLGSHPCALLHVAACPWLSLHILARPCMCLHVLAGPSLHVQHPPHILARPWTPLLLLARVQQACGF